MAMYFKKNLLIVFLFCAAVEVFAQTNEVEMQQGVLQEGSNPRSGILLPRVWFNGDVPELSVQFSNSSIQYTMCVMDMTGAVVYQDNFIANGTMQYFYPGMLPSGTYIIAIFRQQEYYYGYFDEEE